MSRKKSDFGKNFTKIHLFPCWCVFIWAILTQGVAPGLGLVPRWGGLFLWGLPVPRAARSTACPGLGLLPRWGGLFRVITICTD